MTSDADRHTDREAPATGWREPMLATLTEDRFDDPGWVFERKFDGVRCLALRDGDQVRLWTRNRHRVNGTYPEIAEALAAQRSRRFLVDGEIVAFDGRRTSFERLQGRSGISDPDQSRATGIAIFYYVFDLLTDESSDTRSLPLTERKRRLRQTLDFADPVRFTPHRRTNGLDAYREACARGDEGVIAKRADAGYRAGRSRDWLKFKCVHDQELVIGGFTEPRGSRPGLGAILVGYYDGEDLVYAGKVGTGFDQATLRSLRRQLEGLARRESPFTRGRIDERDVSWAKPALVAQIGMTEWTRDGRLRHPRFLGLRSDKDPRDVVRESVS